MKLKCNVCKIGATIEILKQPEKESDLLCCPYCSKSMAYAEQKKYSNKFIWKVLDATYNKEYGKEPITIL